MGFDAGYKPNAEIGKCLQEGGIRLSDGTQFYHDALGNDYRHATIENADGTTARQWQIIDRKTGNFVEYKPEEHAITPHDVKAQSSFSVKATFNKVIDRLRPNKSAKQAEKEEQAVLRKEYIETFREQFKGHLNRMKFVEDLSEEELARLKKENEEIRRANAKAQREQEHLEQSGEQLQEKAEEIYDKNRQN